MLTRTTIAALLPFAVALSIAACNRGEGPKSSPIEVTTANEPEAENCKALPKAEDLKKLVRDAADKGDVGGLFNGRYEWIAVVNRNGDVCAIAVSSDDPAASWPGSRAIAMAKAYTANAFSTDFAPMSTARLYTLSQPGHSLYGAANGNPINPLCLADADSLKKPKVKCGGTIAFGGGVALYNNKTKVGGLGVSGDTACADHEVAKRVRTALRMDPDGGPTADDIQFSKADGASIYSHPLCANTIRNGQKMGDEAPAVGY